ncbi:hypothetical protein [Panacagrimonas sp.]|uniref:hypothetical protein n=1 Tax=Panacagrimonas sp. TaxID=2480088 RepID=UPI003B53058D
MGFEVAVVHRQIVDADPVELQIRRRQRDQGLGQLAIDGFAAIAADDDGDVLETHERNSDGESGTRNSRPGFPPSTMTDTHGSALRHLGGFRAPTSQFDRGIRDHVPTALHLRAWRQKPAAEIQAIDRTGNPL